MEQFLIFWGPQANHAVYIGYKLWQLHASLSPSVDWQRCWCEFTELQTISNTHNKMLTVKKIWWAGGWIEMTATFFFSRRAKSNEPFVDLNENMLALMIRICWAHRIWEQQPIFPCTQLQLSYTPCRNNDLLDSLCYVAKLFGARGIDSHHKVTLCKSQARKNCK